MALATGYYYSGDPRLKYLSHEQWAALFESRGLPGETMAKVVKGEAGYAINIQQRDPGDGMVGYTGIQATPNAWGKDSDAAKYLAKLGGVEALAGDPGKQADMAAFLYKAAGNSISPWYGTKYVTDRDAHYTGNLKPSDFLTGSSPGVATDSDTSAGGGGMFSGLLDNFTRGLLWVALLLGGAGLFVVGTTRVAQAGKAT